MNRLRDGLLVLAVAGCVFFTNLGGARLWDRDEPRNAGCAAEMLAANNWITPVFNGELRPHKPVLTYWFMMSAYALLGVNEFAARFWSAILGTGTCLAVWFIGRRLFGRHTGVWAAVVLATSMMFAVASRAATPDAPLIFFSTLATAVYIAGTTERNGPPGFVRLFPVRYYQVVAMYALMGMAILAKGPVGMVLPTAVIGMFLLICRLPPLASPLTGWRRELLAAVRPFAPWHFLKTCWAMRPLTAIAVALLVALPWYVWVHLRTDGAWTYGFFVTHNVGRAMSAMDGHNGGLWFYPATLLVGFFPWSIFWLPCLIEAVRKTRSDEPTSRSFLFALCWAGVYVGLFSVAKTKLPSYITPCYPGLALLTGALMQRWSEGAYPFPALWRRLALGSLIAAGAIGIIAMPIVASIILPEEKLLGLIGLLPAIGGAWALWQAEKGRPLLAARGTGVVAVLLAVTIFGYAADRVDRHRHIEDLRAAIYGDDPVSSVELVSLSSTEASWVYYSGQTIPMFQDPQRAADYLTTPSSDGRRRALISTASRLKRDAAALPLDACEIQRVPYFMQDDEIVIVTPRRKSAASVTAQSSKSDSLTQ